MRSIMMTALALVATPALAGPLEVTTRMLAATRVAAPDGSVAIRYVAPKRLVPGDAVSFVLAWRNTGTQPIADLVLANPVPASVVYRGVADGMPQPEVTTDGRRYAALSALRVGTRAAVAGDVVGVRWRIATLPAGAKGELAFEAIVR